MQDVEGCLLNRLRFDVEQRVKFFSRFKVFQRYFRNLASENIVDHLEWLVELIREVL